MRDQQPKTLMGESYATVFNLYLGSVISDLEWETNWTISSPSPAVSTKNWKAEWIAVKQGLKKGNRRSPSNSKHCLTQRYCWALGLPLGPLLPLPYVVFVSFKDMSVL